MFDNVNPTDPFVAFDVLTDAIAQGVQDGVRIWCAAAAGAIALALGIVWLVSRHDKRRGR